PGAPRRRADGDAACRPGHRRRGARDRHRAHAPGDALAERTRERLMHLVARGEADLDLGHLTYCNNIHAGEALDDVMASLARHLPAIKQAVAPDRSLGVGL